MGWVRSAWSRSTQLTTGCYVSSCSEVERAPADAAPVLINRWHQEQAHLHRQGGRKKRRGFDSLRSAALAIICEHARTPGQVQT